MNLINQRLFDFERDAYHDGEFTRASIEDILEKQSIFFFYPVDFSFVCPTELGDMQEHCAYLQELNYEVYSVSEDSHYVYKAWADVTETTGRIKHPMLADPNGWLARLFDVLDEASEMAYRASFIMNPEGGIKSYEINGAGIGHNAEGLVRGLETSQSITEHDGKIYPANWQPREEVIAPSLDLVGKIQIRFVDRGQRVGQNRENVLFNSFSETQKKEEKQVTEEIYDLIITGDGSAALSAGIYIGRAIMDTLIIERDKIGGRVTTTSEIMNYPAVRYITGPELMEETRIRTQDFGVAFTSDEIIDVDFSQTVETAQSVSQTYRAYAVSTAIGASARKIGFPGEDEFAGRGIAYCSTCDGEFFQGLDIFVIGGGYAAAEEAVYLTRYGKSVTMIIREPDFICARLTAEVVKDHPKIKIAYNIEVKEITGDDFARKAVLANDQTGGETVYEAPKDSILGLFVFARDKPSTEIFKGRIALDCGYIPTTEDMEINIPGICAAEDLRIKESRQIAAAAADGATTATHAQRYVAE